MHFLSVSTLQPDPCSVRWTSQRTRTASPLPSHFRHLRIEYYSPQVKRVLTPNFDPSGIVISPCSHGSHIIPRAQKGPYTRWSRRLRWSRTVQVRSRGSTWLTIATSGQQPQRSGAENALSKPWRLVRSHDKGFSPVPPAVQATRPRGQNCRSFIRPSIKDADAPTFHSGSGQVRRWRALLPVWPRVRRRRGQGRGRGR